MNIFYIDIILESYNAIVPGYVQLKYETLVNKAIKLASIFLSQILITKASCDTLKKVQFKVDIVQFKQ